MTDFLQTALYIVEIVVGLGLLIFVHEFGHFLMAKKNGVKVETFSLGFGPPIVSRRRGETEYRISWIPLGGYVKMAGENITDERTGADNELTSKPAWQRFQIFVAGALMNLLIAFPICVAAFLVGKAVPSNLVGEPGNAERSAGMRPNDRIVEIDGKPVVSLDQYMLEIVGKTTGSDVPVKVERDGKVLDLLVRQGGSENHRSFPQSNRIDSLEKDGPAERAGLKVDDKLVEIDGEKIYHFSRVEEIFKKSPDKELTIKISRTEEEGRAAVEREVKITPRVIAEKLTPDDNHLVEPVIGSVGKFTPAFGKLYPKDRILSIDAVPVRSFADMQEMIKGSKGGRPLRIAFDRDGTRGETDILATLATSTIGISPIESKVLADVQAGSYYERAGFKSGDNLVGLTFDLDDGKRLDAPEHKVSVAALFHRKGFTAIVDRGGEKVTLKAEGEENKIGDAGISSYRVDWMYRRWSFSEAVSEGLYHPIFIGELTFKVMYKLFKADESVSGLAGPVRIFDVAYKSAKQGPGSFLWILALIAVNLGIFNLLPIPILDGGHVLLLLFEKIKGKPLSMKFVATFQYIGLFFILGLLILVTFNDIKSTFF